MPTIESLSRDIEGNARKLDELSKRLVPYMDDQTKQSRELGETVDATQKKLNEGMERWDKIEAEHAELRAEQDRLRKEMEKEQLVRGRPGVDGGRRSTDWIERMIDKTAIKGYLEGKGGQRKLKLDANDVVMDRIGPPSLDRRGYQVRAADDPPVGSITDTETGDGVLPSPQYGPVVQELMRQPTFSDLVTMIPVGSNAYIYATEAQEFALSMEITSAVAAIDTTITVRNARGARVGATVYAGKDKSKSAVIQSINYKTGIITLTGATGWTASEGDQLWAEDYNFTPQGSIAPRSSIQMDAVTEVIKDLISTIIVHNSQLEDSPALRVILQTRLRDRMVLTRETQMLYGDNTAQELKGLFNNTDIPQYLQSSGLAGDTRTDAIRRAMTLVKTIGKDMPTGVAVSPVDMEYVETAKSLDKRYITHQIHVSNDGIPRLWRAPIVESLALKAGDFTTGNYVSAYAGLRRAGFSLSVSDSADDLWERNMSSMRGIERFGHAFFRPNSLVRGKFDGAPNS